MERITSLRRIVSVLIHDGFSNSYLQLFKPSLRVSHDKELMRYYGQPYARINFPAQVNLFVNNVVTFNGVLVEAENENVFYTNNYWFRISKRAFDIVFSLAVILFLLSWLMPLIALLIRLESKGPVIFTQERSSRDNRTFDCYKFRSMCVNNDCNSSQTQKGDPRITRVGAFLRRTNLDELPQFFNVLMGDMSVVGPRPHMLAQTREYSELIETFMIRHLVKPGITGWAQANGLRGRTATINEMLNRVEADVWYLKNWSFVLDMYIILLTVLYTITGNRNAY